jgi:ATP-dependent Clp protease ATP-binding subunit ClpC
MATDSTYRYTVEAEQALALASEERKRTDHAYVGTEQILIGILRQGTSKTAERLNALGVDVEGARRWTERIIRANGQAGGVDNGYTERTKVALRLAYRRAVKLGVEEIDTDHILLGILYEGEGVAVPVLQNLSVDIDRLRASLIS